MDSKELRELMEAYTQVYAPQEEIEEAVKGADPEMRKAASAERRAGDKRLPPSKGKEYAAQQKQSIAFMDKLTKKNKNVVGLVSKEELDIFDVVLEFLQTEGYAKTIEEAQWIMANVLDEEVISMIIGEGVRPGNVEKPLDRAAFKKRRRSLAGKEASAEARKRGHEGKQWYNSGRTYSPDEAKSRRKNMSDTHRSLSYGTAESPDDNKGYPAVKTKNPKKLRKQKAMGELG